MQLRSGDEASATRNFSEAASGPGDSPWTARAQFESGQLAYKHQPPDLAKAAAQLGKVLTFNGGKAPEELAAAATYLLGWVDFDQKHYADAAAKWKQVVSAYPKNPLAPDASFQQGAALKEAGQDEASLAALKQYVATYPDGKYAARAKQLAAACLTTLKRDAEAKALLEPLAQAKDPGDTVLYDLAWAQRNTKDIPAATETYRRLLQECPTSELAPAARTELGEFLYNDKKYDEAARLLAAAIDDKSARPQTVSAAAYRLGWCYEKLARTDLAAEAFRKFLAAPQGATDEMIVSAMYQSSVADASAAKFDEAQKSLKNLLAKYPSSPQAPIALLKLGDVQSDASDFPSALKTFTDYIARYPKEALVYRAYFGAGWSLENLKRYAEARDAFTKAINLNNGETAAQAQFQIGETYLEEGKFELATGALVGVEDVYNYPTWSARALLEAGKAYEQLKQADQAKQFYSRVIAKYKDLPEAKAAADRLKAL